MAALDGALFVADTGNHLIRAIDLETLRVRTVAGTGRKGEGVAGRPGDDPRAIAMRSPWALLALQRQLLIAMAGSHQIWVYDLDDNSIGPCAGSGRDMQEGVVQTIVGHGLFDFGDQDGAPRNVLLQHPLDVAVDGDVLYVADSYNNKVKAIVFGSMETRTVFGDGSRAALHEPGGLTIDQGRVLIADTNNHRILVGDPASGSLEVLELRTEAEA
jgi:DNA-binding beta-propeller fold protein YncE